MTAVTVSPAWLPMIQPARFVRNGLVVPPYVESAMRADANRIMAFRGKNLFVAPGYCDPPSGGVGTAEQWRWYGHTSPYCKRLHVHVLMAQQDHGTLADSYATFKLYDSANVQIGATLEFHYGASSAGTNDVPSDWQDFYATIDVTADIDVHGLFSVVDGARLIDGLVFEETLAPDTDNGYFASITAGSNIYDSDRQNLATLVNLLLRRGGSQCFNWNVDGPTPITTTSATKTNIIDLTSVAPSSQTPGFTLDMTGKNRDSETTVPCKLAVYGKWTAGVDASKVHVELVDSAGTTIADIKGYSAGGGWLTGQCDLPASAAKYDLRFYSTNADLLSVYAVSCFEHAT